MNKLVYMYVTVDIEYVRVLAEGSNDEGIQISRPRGGASADIARSLPVNMPHLPNERPTHLDMDDYVSLLFTALRRSRK